MWLHKANSSELNLSRDEATAFNSETGEIRKTVAPKGAKPDFDYGILGVRYKSKGGATEAADAEAEEEAARQAAAQKQAAAAKQTRTATANNSGRSGSSANAMDGMKAKEQQSAGYTKGYLTYAMGKVINSPKVVGAILNNKNVISGFMARGTVKDATSSPEALANYLKGSGPANFLNNPVVKAALSNPAVVGAVASSGLVSAMLDTPAAKALMNDPQALGDLIASNPEVAGLMTNPDILAALANNPKTSGVLGRLNK